MVELGGGLRTERDGSAADPAGRGDKVVLGGGGSLPPPRLPASSTDPGGGSKLGDFDEDLGGGRKAIPRGDEVLLGGGETKSILDSEDGDPHMLSVASKFAKDFYEVMERAPHSLYLLYHKRCKVTWSLIDCTLRLSTPKQVQRAIEEHVKQLPCFYPRAYKAHMLKKELHIFATGAASSHLFVQTFVIHLDRNQILSDILDIFPSTLESLNEQVRFVPNELGGSQNVVPTHTNDAARLKNMITNKTTGAAGPAKESASLNEVEHAVFSEQAGPMSTRSRRMLRLPNKYLADFLLSSGGKDCVQPAEDKLISVCVVYDPRMLLHVQDPSEPQILPEVPERLSSIYEKFEEDGLLARCEILRPQPATMSQLELVHGHDYVNFISKLPERTQQDVEKYVGQVERINIYFSDGTKEACFLAAGSVVKACDAIGQGHHQRAFCVVRPPGHHAKRNQAGGYCFFNNVALGASYLLETYASFKKILVVDFDVHHGNGTQEIFYNNQHILFVSIHKLKVGYPNDNQDGSKFVGSGQGEGFNLNIPLEGMYSDNDLLHVFDEVVVPMAREFNPDAILISAGYDAATGDLLGNCAVTPFGFAIVTEKLVQAGQCPAIMVLEGGYLISATAECASNCLRVLLGDKAVRHSQVLDKPILAKTKVKVKSVKKIMSRYWDVFKD